MRRKHFLALLTVCTILFGLAGCQGNIVVEPFDTVQVTEQTAIGAESASENSAVVTAIKTIEPPEEGWTHEQISEVTYLLGEPFSLPCKLEDLPEDFEIGTIRYRNKDAELNTYITVNGQDSCFYDAVILLDGENAGLVHYYENGTEKIVFSVDLDPDLHGRNILVINGINQNSSFSDIKQALGENFVQNTDYPFLYSYEVINSEYPEENIMTISFDENDESAGICYSLFKIKKVR